MASPATVHALTRLATTQFTQSRRHQDFALLLTILRGFLADRPELRPAPVPARSHHGVCCFHEEHTRGSRRSSPRP